MRLHSRRMSHHLQQSRDRFDRVRGEMDKASLRLAADDLAGVEAICAAVLEDLEGAWLTFKHDWYSIDLLLGSLSVARAMSDRKRLGSTAGIEQLIKRALEVRMAWAQGQGEDAA
jgi:hypothetical protein